MLKDPISLKDVQMLSAEIEAKEKERGVSGESHIDADVKDLISLITRADQHVAEAMADYGCALRQLTDAQQARAKDMKPIATAEARQAIVMMLTMLGHSTEANVVMHEKLMRLGDSHNVVMFCCRGK